MPARAPRFVLRGHCERDRVAPDAALVHLRGARRRSRDDSRDYLRVAPSDYLTRRAAQQNRTSALGGSEARAGNRHRSSGESRNGVYARYVKRIHAKWNILLT